MPDKKAYIIPILLSKYCIYVDVKVPTAVHLYEEITVHFLDNTKH